MGKHDSSLTRVAPVFDNLLGQDPSAEGWLSSLLQLPAGGHAGARLVEPQPPLRSWGWGQQEKALAPPVSLLSWLVRNISSTKAAAPDGDSETERSRQLLFAGDPVTVSEALSNLRPGQAPKKWYIFEGMSYPDVYLETDDTLVVIEGKRTEWAPTVKTSWMPKRHQMLRHIDCAWEIRGRRRVYGFFIVEGQGGADAVDVPERWREAVATTVSPTAIKDSLPHRGPEEQSAIAACFLGATTWQALCRRFNILWDSLPDIVR
jgi:hypothetical protein